MHNFRHLIFGFYVVSLGFFFSSRAYAEPFRPVGLNFPLDAPVPEPLRVVPAFRRLQFARPVFLTHAPGDTQHLFVVEQWGSIKIFPASDDVSAKQVETFLDLTKVVSADDGEMGLLGLAFSPDYASSREFYVSYTLLNPRRLVVARIRADANFNRAESGPEVVFEIPKNEDNENHNGGMIAFGPDGMLYISCGDGGGAGDRPNNSQSMEVNLGKILRINPRVGRPTYEVPADNPFVKANGARSEIWALGLRNPWRFSFDRNTGELWEGDVGQDRFEEINIIKKGGNYGWRVFEGNQEYLNPQHLAANGFEAPVFIYPHNPELSITGGYVYRGQKLAELQGKYIYGDYGSGKIWALEWNGHQVVSNKYQGRVASLNSFGEDAAGELYMLSLDGKIYRFVRNENRRIHIEEKLSRTGIFSDLRTLTTVAGLEEYEVNSPLWSDGAVKRRWIALPAQGKIEFHSTDPWNFPIGTIFVKHFELPVSPTHNKRLETRVLIHHRDGWRGYTYKWDAADREATLQNESSTQSFQIESADGQRREQQWYFPSRSDCLSCHAGSAGDVLGVKTSQLNRTVQGHNQLDRWNRSAVFDQDIGPVAAQPQMVDPYGQASLELRARSYLAANCAQCHNPNAVAPGRIDFRFETNLANTRLIDVDPTQGDLDIPRELGISAKRIKSGNKNASVLWRRMGSLDPQRRMPPLASGVVDAKAVELIGEWIDSLENPFTSPPR